MAAPNIAKHIGDYKVCIGEMASPLLSAVAALAPLVLPNDWEWCGSTHMVVISMASSLKSQGAMSYRLNLGMLTFWSSSNGRACTCASSVSFSGRRPR